ncbi:MAG: hypothetical protein LAN71_06390 [Acidobacteriia bacterium]|nr:hypothetical protein [Terriglobia bacterium]
MSAAVPSLNNQPQSESVARSFYAKLLLLFFLFSLPFANPIVHGDGVGYYAFVRAPLIQHNLRFEEDWRHANLQFAQSRTLPDGQVMPQGYTQTGHLYNHFPVGPAILWTPFLALAHAGVLLANSFGAHIPADGFSAPYRIAMAVGTAFYGFLGLFLSFFIACRFVHPRWAFLSTLGIWTSSSLPVYMYFNPSWSHAHSVFAVALFLWFWLRTRPDPTLRQWLLLGLLGGLLLNIYFPNGVFLLLPFVDSLRAYWSLLRSPDKSSFFRKFSGNLIFLAALFFAFLPTLVTRRIIFGGFFRFGTYGALAWDFHAPHWLPVLVSSDHGLLIWTPLLAFALAGLLFPMRRSKEVVAYFGLSAVAFYYVIACYPYWDGMASFGNRFLISLSPIFVLGLALLLERANTLFPSPRRAFPAFALLFSAFALWNAGFVYQWGAHLIPPRGPISWAEMIHNQFSVVPRKLAHDLNSYFFRRGDLMHTIEQKDIEQLHAPPTPHP